MASSSVPPNIYQFKITLKDIQPPIWRRIQVPEDYTFHQLHVAIQHAMGWESTRYDYHLHQFDIFNPRTSKMIAISIPDPDSTGIRNGKKVKISTHFSMNGNKTANYEYDFGDGWEHDVLLEGVLSAEPYTCYPKCVDGERACPPEDCGGVYGYVQLLRNMARSGRMTLDPENFDPR